MRTFTVYITLGDNHDEFNVTAHSAPEAIAYVMVNHATAYELRWAKFHV